MLLYAHVWLMLKTLYDCHFLIGADMNADEPPKSVSVVGVMIGVCGAAVLIVGGAFKKLQGKHKGQELLNPVEANPTEDVPVEISVL